MLASSGGASSRIGPRRENEDSYGLIPAIGLYVVADGMGGLSRGKFAATTVTRTLLRSLDLSTNQENLRNALAVAIAQSRAAVIRQAEGEKVGTTVAALLVRPNGDVEIAHVGDSRIYCLRESQLTLLTRDHSVVSEWEDSTGLEAPPAIVSQYGHLVTRAISPGSNGFPTHCVFQAEPGDRFALTTDGVHDYVDHDGLLAALRESDATGAAEELTRQAVEELDGEDNATAVVVDAFESL